MSRLTVELAFDPPNVDPSGWADHTAALRTEQRGGRLLHVRRGRSDETTPVAAATGDLRLKNADRAYDPRVSTLRPWTHVQVQLERDGASTLPMFRGFLEGIDQAHVEAEDRYATARLVDAVKWLAGTDVALDRPAELSGTRIAAILDAVGWPAGLRDLDAGQVIVDATGEIEDKALSLIEEAAEAEDGTFGTLADGRLEFSDRHARLDLEPTLTVEIDVPVQHSGTWDDDLLVNVARVELADGTVARHEDPGSIAIYGRREWESPDLPVAEAEAEGAGMWAIFRYATAHERIDPVQFHIVDPTSPLVGIAQGQLIVLRRRWPDDTVDDIELVVEGVDDTLTAATWTRTCSFSPWWGDHDWLVVAQDDTDPVFGLDEGVAAP